MSAPLLCIRCGNTMGTQEALAGELLNTADGLMHEHCGEEVDVVESENRRREEHGDILLPFFTSGASNTVQDDPDGEKMIETLRAAAEQPIDLAPWKPVVSPKEKDRAGRALRGD